MLLLVDFDVIVDKLIWLSNKSCTFSVKSTYNAHITGKVGGEVDPLWNAIWRAKIHKRKYSFGRWQKIPYQSKT